MSSSKGLERVLVRAGARDDLLESAHTETGGLDELGERGTLGLEAPDLASLLAIDLARPARTSLGVVRIRITHFSSLFLVSVDLEGFSLTDYLIYRLFQI